MTQEKAAVALSTKSWHYKLVKAVLGKAAPTPQNMHNLCPYFWLLVLSILVCPVVLPLRAIIWTFLSIEEWTEKMAMTNMIVPAATSWSEGLTDLDVYQIYRHDKAIKKSYKKAFGTFDHYHEKNTIEKPDFVSMWYEKRHKKKAFTKESDRYNQYYTKDFEKWIETQEVAYEKFLADEDAREYEKRQKKDQYDEKLRDFRNNTDDFFDRIRDAVSSWKNLIKWTKRTVGAIITIACLVATYFIVSFVGHGVLWLVEHWDWTVLMYFGIVCGGAGILYLIIYLGHAWVVFMQDKGTDLWYVKAAYTFFLIIFWPLKIIFYHFLWQLILVNLWYLIKKGAIALWNSLLGFLGIFGEYFGASYGDYCPGIEWEENKD